MTKHLTHKFNLTIGLIASLISLNCLAEVTQPASASPKALNYESSLSEFKSINTESAKLSANEAESEMKGMDHSKMSTDEMKDMQGMDHGKMQPDDMKGMDHSKMDQSKMSADEMKDMKVAPKKSSKLTKVKKLKPTKKMAKPMPPIEAKPTAPAATPAATPAEVNPHQNHQM